MGARIQNAYQTQAQVPIAGIIAWAKSITGAGTLDAQFVECNGQVLADVTSPLNGETMPDLNGATTKRFLRGSSTSGTTGGTEIHKHDLKAGNKAPPNGSDFSIVETENAATLPSYYEVVWVIRVK